MIKYRSKIKDGRLIVRAKLSSDEKINDRELEFFEKKQIRSLLRARSVKHFGFRSMEYTGEVGISLSERMKKPFSKYDFLFLMEQVADLVQRLQKNSMPVYKIVWDVGQVFVNETTREAQFIYLPLENVSREVDLLAFVDSILYSMRLKQEGNTEYTSRFAYFIKGMKEFDARKIEQFILREDESIVHIIKRQSYREDGFITDKREEYYDHYDQKKEMPEETEETGLLEETENMEETDLLTETDEMEGTGLLTETDEMEGTGLLMETDDMEEIDLFETEETGLLVRKKTSHSSPTLLRVQTGERICVDKPVFRLGKERSYVDYFVQNNPAVSRSHVDLIARSGGYFVKDLNSKNRTYLNGAPIPKWEEVELKDGDHLRLANEEFEFML